MSKELQGLNEKKLIALADKSRSARRNRDVVRDARAILIGWVSAMPGTSPDEIEKLATIAMANAKEIRKVYSKRGATE